MWRQGYNIVVGIDEAGRGPLAGPVVAASFAIKNFQFSKFNFQSILNNKILKQVRDSKKLSEKQREEIYNVLINHPQIEWGVGIVSEKVIDKINILEATKLAMEKSVKNLDSRFPSFAKASEGQCAGMTRARKNLDSRFRGNDAGADFLLLDGNFKINCATEQKSIIKGDQKVFSISAASIIAKVTRDKLMQKYHRKYPQYGFNKHKGYGTASHFANLEKFGPCKIHRKTFYPASLFV